MIIAIVKSESEGINSKFSQNIQQFVILMARNISISKRNRTAAFHYSRFMCETTDGHGQECSEAKKNYYYHRNNLRFVDFNA